MIKVNLFAVAILLVGFSGAAFAQGACTTPGTVAFPELPDVRASIVPSVHRQLSSLGRQAVAAGCQIEVTCVSVTDADREALRLRNRQCTAAVQAIVRYETRAAVRTTLGKNIVQSKVAAGGSFQAGTVYVTLR